MNSEKIAKKFYEWMDQMKSGNDRVVFIAKSKGQCIYAFKNVTFPVNAVKVWVDKGEGLEEYISYEGTNAQHVVDFSLIVKNSSKLIFADGENKLHAYGLKDVVNDFKKIIGYIKAGKLITIVFASAEKNSVTVIEKIVDTEEDAATSCLFDNLSHPAPNFNESAGVFNELFDR